MPQEKLEAIQPRPLGAIKFFPKALTPTAALEALPEVIEALAPLLNSGVDLKQLFGGAPITEETIRKFLPAIGGLARVLVAGKLLRIALVVLAESFVFNPKSSQEKVFLRTREAVDLAFAGSSGQLIPAVWIALGVTYLDFFPAIAQAVGTIQSQSPSADSTETTTSSG